MDGERQEQNEPINTHFPKLLQTIMGKKMLSKTELLAFCNKDFKEFFNDLNFVLHDIGFKVMMTFDKLGNQVGCLVNLESDDVSRIGTSYTPLEISLFRKMIGKRSTSWWFLPQSR
jgi:Nse1 non-SMC component of SMC5-6 complex